MQNNNAFRVINHIKKENATPYMPTELSDLSKGSIAFLEKRGISEEVAKSEGLKIANKWMPQLNKKQNVLAFPFIKDNKRVATKYRDDKKNMSQDKGGEKCFYRFDEMKKGKKIYITEGEIDALTLVQCGFSDGVTSVIVFANRRDQVRRLHERLRKSGIACGILSGEIPQAKRTRTLEQFKNGEIKVLVATDVAGRGIHVEGISHVVNYNLPEDPEDYVHRIGRTGRAGATGTSISFASEDDAFLLPDLEALLGSPLECTHPPEDLLS